MNDEYKVMHRIEARGIAALQQVFMSTVGLLRRHTQQPAFVLATRTNNLPAAMRALPFDAFENVLRQRFTSPMRTLSAAGGAAAAELLGEQIGGSITFDMNTTTVMYWVNHHASTLAANLTTTARDVIRLRLQHGLTSALPTDLTVERAFLELGLANRQAVALDRFYKGLEGRGVSSAVLRGRTRRYGAALLRYRANLIGRTEAVNVVCGGQELLWDQALQRRILTLGMARKRWVLTPEDQLDYRVCEPMPYMEENQNVAIGSFFTTGDKRQVMRPAAHPLCQCGMRLELA